MLLSTVRTPVATGLAPVPLFNILPGPGKAQNWGHFPFGSSSLNLALSCVSVCLCVSMCIMCVSVYVFVCIYVSVCVSV